MPAEEPEIILQTSRAFGLLLNNDLMGARSQLEASAESVYNVVGLAFVAFVEATIGMEEQLILQALDCFFKAEEAIKHAKSQPLPPEPKGSAAAHWWTAGTQYDIMMADVLLCQAILHFMTESNVESMKGIFKISKAYKLFASTHQSVFSPLLVKDPALTPASAYPSLGDDIQPFVAGIQEIYSAPKPLPGSASPSSPGYLGALGFSGLRRKFGRLTTTAAQNGLSIPPSSSSPGSSYGSWTDDPLAQLVIGGSAFGYGLFGLVLSLLPPKVRKMLSWVGLNGSSTIERRESRIERNKCIRWLSFSAASCPQEMHGMLAGLSLLGYRALSVLVVGWQAARERSITSYISLLDTIAGSDTEKPKCDGTLWTLHRSRIHRFNKDAAKARDILVQSIDDGKRGGPSPRFMQAEALLGYELALIRVSLGEWMAAGEGFLSMKEVNSWSHATYQFVAIGCFLLAPLRSEELDQKIGLLFGELPSLMSKKRMMSEPPPIEVYISRKLAQYKARHSRLVEQGLVTADRISCFWDSVQISPIEEFSLILGVYEFAPGPSLHTNVERLCRLTPVLKIDIEGAALNEQPLKNDTKPIPLASEEIAMRNVLLGAQLSCLGEFDAARKVLEAITLSGETEPFTYISSLIQRALIELRVGDLTPGDVAAWKVQIDKATLYLDSVINFPKPYLMRGRTESKVGMIRDEIDEKKAELDII